VPLRSYVHLGLRAPLKEGSWTTGWGTCRQFRAKIEPQFVIHHSMIGQYPCPFLTESQPDALGDKQAFPLSAGTHLHVGVQACLGARRKAKSPSKLGFFPLQSAEEAEREFMSRRPQVRNKLSSVILLQSKLGGCQFRGE